MKKMIEMFKKYNEWCEYERRNHKKRNNVIMSVFMVTVGLILWAFSTYKMNEKLEQDIKNLKEVNELLEKQRKELIKIKEKEIKNETN